MNFDLLDTQTREAVAVQLGSLQRQFAGAEGAIIAPADELSESFQVWQWNDALENENRYIRRRLFRNNLVFSGLWHHQLRTGGVSHAYALSLDSSDSGLTDVIGIYHSDLSVKFEEAIHQLDSIETPDKEEIRVRLVRIPLRQTTVFHLWAKAGKDDQVMIIEAPTESAVGNPLDLLKADVFQQRLLNAPRIEGINLQDGVVE